MKEPDGECKASPSCLQDLATRLYTNPHSGHATWDGDPGTIEMEAQARALTLAMCRARSEDYECIFTSGATGALPTSCSVADSPCTSSLEQRRKRIIPLYHLFGAEKEMIHPLADSPLLYPPARGKSLLGM